MGLGKFFTSTLFVEENIKNITTSLYLFFLFLGTVAGQLVSLMVAGLALRVLL